MSKPRVYEIAKDLEASSKVMLDELLEYGIEIKNHMGTLEPEEMDVIYSLYLGKYDQTKSIEEIFALINGPDDAPAKEEKKKETPVAEVEIPAGPVEIVKEDNRRVVDTRQNVVDLDKLDTEKLEQLVNMDDEQDARTLKKQKIKKGPAQQPQQQGKKQGTPEQGGKQQDKDGQRKNRPGKDDRQQGKKQGAPVQGKKQGNAPAEKGKANAPKQKEAPAKPKITHVEVPDEIAVGEFASMMGIPAATVVKKLFELGIMASVSQNIDFDTAALIGEDLGFTVSKLVVVSEEDKLFNDVEDAPESLRPRSPVVVVMGHVDHGKTSLLDAIRNTNVIASEAGGITQHIGAYRVRIHDKKITFLDTPGHEAFTAMRMRGAQVTDVAILVVAADDGIMPQTVEAINHAKAADVTIVVAINKIDKEGANPDRIKQELTEYGLVPEEWGGDTICVPISAKFNQNIDSLLEMVTLVAEMKELKANPDRRGKGTVIEAQLDKGRGPVATVLVQNGTLRVGDYVVAGTAVGRVRAMVDDRGAAVKKAGPSVPVEIIGLSEVPEGGDLVYAVDDERKAKEVVEKRKFKLKQEQNQSRRPVSLDALFDQIKEGEMKELPIVIKADVNGSVEAVRQSLEKLSNEEVRVTCIHGGVGGITESDVMLASASGAIIVGFNVRPDSGALASAERNSVDMRLYRVIYDAIDEIEAAMKGMLDPKFKEVVLGHAEIRTTFKVSGVGTIGGCYVQDGKIQRNAQVRIVRDGIVIHEGVLASLKRFKDDAKEVASGYECGMGIEGYNDLKEGDIIEAFVMEEIKE
ncbi:MAG: translation initiation factor IF-2 [Ruminococcaceae bacterium]|nr:translation initiation factor IF-2 [Oscillospiraceae bacterium]